MIEAWFDGAVEPYNPGGHGGFGMLVKRNGVVIHSEAIYIGRWPALSNNCAEYAGCIAALRFLIRENLKQATVYGDADMIVKQVNGKWRIREGAYIPYFHEAYALKQQLPQVKIVWIPREQNAEADDLSKQAVTKRPTMIGFQLDPTIEPVVAQIPRKLTRRQRRRREYIEERKVLLPKLHEDEAWELFKTRYGDL